jgi:Rho guanine nucleotide exchange factor 17
MKSTATQSESSSSDSEEPDIKVPSVSSSVISNLSQLTTDESQMWLGLEDGCCLIYNCNDNIRIKKNKIKIQHVSAVHSILYMDNRVFVSLANGHIYVYTRKNSAWNTSNPRVLSIGSTASCPVTKLLNVYGKLWCAIAHCVKILNVSTLEVESSVEISSETKPISNMTLLNQYVWISLQNSATVLCCNVSK